MAIVTREPTLAAKKGFADEWRDKFQLEATVGVAFDEDGAFCIDVTTSQPLLPKQREKLPQERQGVRVKYSVGPTHGIAYTVEG